MSTCLSRRRARFSFALLAAAALITAAGALTPLLRAQAAPAAQAAAQAPAAAVTPVAAGPILFDDYFIDKTLRMDIYQVGDSKSEFITLDNIYEEPVWSENPKNLVPPFEVCHYAVKVYDKESNRLIFAHAFDGLFGEYKTTTPALNGVKAVYPRSVRLPEPKKPVHVVIEQRDKKLALQPLYSLDIDPADYHIIRETPNRGDWIFEQQKSGDPHDKVDLAFLSEGYTAEDKDKFKADVEKMSNALFAYDPYNKNKERFNIYGVFRASAERGMDEPRQRRYKSTALGASYNTFDTDRYLTIQDDMAISRMAAAVPHDTVVVLVNTNRYGGGGITMDVCVTSVDNATSPRIFVHEFGHSFAALADEYVGDVAYNDMYPEGVEPLEVNITRLLDPQNIKWKQFVTPGTPLPTPAARGATAVGAFEGAGYIAKGMYRPQMNCIMGNALPPPNDAFCAVCKYGIQRMIDYYSPPPAAPAAK